MFHATLETIWAGPNYLKFLHEEAKSDIKTRGYSLNAHIPSDLANPKWFLAVNDIAYSYCPTNRYLYFKKVENKRALPTWESYRGRIIDDLIPEIFKKVSDYSIAATLKSFKVSDQVKASFIQDIAKCKANVKPDQFLVPPSATEVDTFFSDVTKLMEYESGLANSLLNFRISNIYDINLQTEFSVLFPFDFKLKICAPTLGLSGSAEMDFLIRKSIVGEIKSNEWFEFYHVGLAGYALAFEADRKTDLDLGMVICPKFKPERTVPLYQSNSTIKIIAEPWRKMFLKNRNIRTELVKNGKDPGKPTDKTKCEGCGFHKECWP